MRDVDQIITAELSFVPLGSDDYNGEIRKVIDIIKDSQQEFTVGLMSTTIRGAKNTILDLIRQIFEEMNEQCKFTMILKLSNECGCKK
jgi:uncharacterized protein YqgV (UPF0045/DUF77 family)